MGSNVESWKEKRENYRKNLACMQEVTDRLLGHMKGHGYSFRREITDGKGKFSQEKLCGLVKELVGHWAETLREITDTDPDTGESVAEPYIRERRELYGLYLYLVMRCSLCEGAYAKVYPYGYEAKERTDFAFLLEQARRLSGRWCVMAEPDGGRRNELYEGFDEHFGFHLYESIADPEGQTADSALSPRWNLPRDRRGSLTTEGNMKGIFIRHLTGPLRGGKGNGAATASTGSYDDDDGCDNDNGCNSDSDNGCNSCDSGSGYEDEAVYEDYEGYDAFEDYDDDDPYPFPDFESKAEFEAARMDQWAEEYERKDYLAALALTFACQDEYLEACTRFAKLFEKARPDILREFYQGLEEVVNLYLAARDLSPLTDTDKTLGVYSSVYDGPCQQAKRCERGLQWENL